MSLSPSPSGRPVRRVAIISFQITKKGPTLGSPHWGRNATTHPKGKNSTPGSAEGAGLSETNNGPGDEGFDEAPPQCPEDDFFGLQMISPSSSISRDGKNKDDRSPPQQLVRPAAESGPLRPSASPDSKSNLSAPRSLCPRDLSGESAASRSAPGRPVPGRHARRAPDPAGGRAGAARRRRAPRPPPPAGRSQAPPRPAPAGPGLSAAAGGRGAGRRPPDSPLASPGRAGAALGRPRSPSDRSASLRCRAELFPGGGFLASSSLDPPPPTPPPSPPLPRGGSGAEYFLS